MTPEVKKAIAPLMDPRVLAIFMLAVTQDGFINDLIPADGSPPNYPKNFGRLGLAKDILDDFVKRVGTGANAANNRALFAALTKLLTTAYNDVYQPPDCPFTQVLKDLVTVTNESLVMLASTQKAISDRAKRGSQRK